MKTRLFKKKFDFQTYTLTDIHNIGQQFLNIYYVEMCVGCADANELFVREFIKTPNNIPDIYNGMSLNTEPRLFYDFDQRKALGIFNYWNIDTMLKHFREHDLNTFFDYC